MRVPFHSIILAAGVLALTSCDSPAEEAADSAAADMESVADSAADIDAAAEEAEYWDDGASEEAAYDDGADVEAEAGDSESSDPRPGVVSGDSTSIPPLEERRAPARQPTGRYTPEDPVIQPGLGRAPASVERRIAERPEPGENETAPAARRSLVTNGDPASPSETVDEPAADDIGRAVLSADDEMDVGQSYPVLVQVGEEARLEAMEEVAESMGTTTTSGQLQLASHVCATLTAQGFEVTEPLRQCQDRGSSPQLSFAWTVSPKVERPLTLQAKVVTYDRDENALDQRDTQTLSIAINADWLTRFNLWVERLTESMGGVRNLLLAILAVLGVLSAIVWRWRNLGRAPSDPEIENEP